MEAERGAFLKPTGEAWQGAQVTLWITELPAPEFTLTGGSA
jgi:hypothetical protein